MVEKLKSDLQQKGWFVTKEYLEELQASQAENSSILSVKSVSDQLLHLDIKEFGEGFIRSGNKTDTISGPGVVQVTKVINVSAPKEDQEAPCAVKLFRILLSDGLNSISALDLDGSTGINLNTAPGTKFLLSGQVPLQSGFLLVSKTHLQCLGGKVEQLYEAWRLKLSVAKHNRQLRGGTDAPPPFVPFGSRLAPKSTAVSSAIAGGGVKVMDLVAPSLNTGGVPTTGGEERNAEAEAKLEQQFRDRREAALGAASVAAPSAQAPAVAPTAGPSSKFAQHQKERGHDKDAALAQLIELGAHPKDAKRVLKVNDWNVQRSVDLWLSGEAQKMLSASRGRGRGGRRGGRRGGGGSSDEEGPRIDTGPVSRPRTHLTIADFLPGDHPLAGTQEISVSQQYNQSDKNRPTSGPNLGQYLLYVNASCLAECMDGSFKSATVVDIDTRNKWITVYYQHTDDTQQVTLDSVRTLDNKRIDASQVRWPPAQPAPMQQQRTDYYGDYRGGGYGRGRGGYFRGGGDAGGDRGGPRRGRANFRRPGRGGGRW